MQTLYKEFKICTSSHTLLRLVVSVKIPGAGAPLLSINTDRSSLQWSKPHRNMVNFKFKISTYKKMNLTVTSSVDVPCLYLQSGFNPLVLEVLKWLMENYFIPQWDNSFKDKKPQWLTWKMIWLKPSNINLIMNITYMTV